MATIFYNIYRFFNERIWLLQLISILSLTICVVIAGRTDITLDGKTVPSGEIVSAFTGTGAVRGSIAISFILIVSAYLLFRRKAAAILVVLPVIFGSVLALAITTIITGNFPLRMLFALPFITGIGIAWSVILFGNFHRSRSIPFSIKDVSSPLFICGTALALSLVPFIKSDDQSLRSLSLFTALSLGAVILFTLLVSVHLLKITRYKSTTGDYRT
ncbi:MAG TPA: hypothetical protein VF857_03690, partial [Spirochaetota bacterium]